MKESFAKFITLFANRAVVSALFVIVGSIAMLWGRTIDFDEKLVDALVAIAGGLLTAFGYAGALYTPVTKKEEEKK